MQLTMILAPENQAVPPQRMLLIVPVLWASWKPELLLPEKVTLGVAEDLWFVASAIASSSSPS